MPGDSEGPQVMDMDEALEERANAAMSRWTRVISRMMSWNLFTERKIVAVLQIAESHPRRRKDTERAEVER